MFGLSPRAATPLFLFLTLGFVGLAIYCRWRINQESVSRGQGSSFWWVEQADFPGRTTILMLLAVAIIGGLVSIFITWRSLRAMGVEIEKKKAGQVTPGDKPR